MVDRDEAEPVVEVMLPAYGDGPLIRETIDSVLKQDDPGWRLVVVDDGAELTGAALGQWLAGWDDERVQYRQNPSRLGVNRNFQRCVDLATADLVMLLGADDRLLPDFVGRVRRTAAQHPEFTVLHMGATVIDGAGRPTSTLVDRVKRLTALRVKGSRITGGEELATSLLHGDWMYFPSCVFRRGPLQAHGFRVGYDVVLDLDLFMRILLDGGRFLFVERPGIEYRRHSASVSSAGAEDGSRFAEEYAYFVEAEAVAVRAGWPRAARAARWHWTSRLHALSTIPGLVVHGRYASARSIARVALATIWRRSSTR